MFGRAVTLAVWEAGRNADALAALVRGQPVTGEHPVLGVRAEPHGVFDDGDRIALVGTNATTSRFGSFHLGQLEGHPLLPWTELTVTASAAIGTFTAGDRPASTAVVTSARHPALGAGALILTRLGCASGAEAAQLAIDCNAVEAGRHTGIARYGAWSTDPDNGPVLAHVAFAPNTITGLSPHIVLAAYDWLRCDWLARHGII